MVIAGIEIRDAALAVPLRREVELPLVVGQRVSDVEQHPVTIDHHARQQHAFAEGFAQRLLHVEQAVGQFEFQPLDGRQVHLGLEAVGEGFIL